jgi:hypothetical protein
VVDYYWCHGCRTYGSLNSSAIFILTKSTDLLGINITLERGQRKSQVAGRGEQPRKFDDIK